MFGNILLYSSFPFSLLKKLSNIQYCSSLQQSSRSCTVVYDWPETTVHYLDFCFGGDDSGRFICRLCTVGVTIMKSDKF